MKVIDQHRLCFLAIWLLAMTGCSRDTLAAGRNDPPSTQPAEPPPYVIPDKLPAPAKVEYVVDGDVRKYKVTWDRQFKYDLKRAQLALDINTVNWVSGGSIKIINKKDDEVNGHAHAIGPSPTTADFERNPEHVVISVSAQEWVKEGFIYITISNPHVDDPTPKIYTVELVAR